MKEGKLKASRLARVMAFSVVACLTHDVPARAQAGSPNPAPVVTLAEARTVIEQEETAWAKARVALDTNRFAAWPYEKGHINREMLRRYLLGLEGPVYYIAGPSGMVTAKTDLLNSSGVSDDDMKTEEFGDYKQYQDPSQSDQGTANNRSDSAL